MAKVTKILYVASECTGLASTGGLGEVASSLPIALNKISNINVRVALPLYKKIKDDFKDDLKYIASSHLMLAWRNVDFNIYSLTKDEVTYYLIDNDYYFNRDKLYGYYDDGERFAFFSKAIFSLFELTKFYPSIIHTNDWQCALVNIYLDILYKKQGTYMDIKSVYTIHNIEYQGWYDYNFYDDVIGLDHKYMNILDYSGNINLSKGAIVCSDIINTVSPKYAEEIKTKEFSFGLHYIINKYQNKVKGIINGINYDFYDPSKDDIIYEKFDLNSLDKKQNNKLALQKELGLKEDKDVCLISVISRLAGHKGLDLLLERFEDLLQENVNVVILGTGEERFEQGFTNIANLYNTKAKVLLTFNTKLAKKIYASSDLFLMPSKMEPCGLSQMIASRYGTVPIVRATGGLYDTIKTENGYFFEDYQASELLKVTNQAINDFYNHKDVFKAKQKCAIEKDFSWLASAKEYIKMYKIILK